MSRLLYTIFMPEETTPNPEPIEVNPIPEPLPPSSTSTQPVSIPMPAQSGIAKDLLNKARSTIQSRKRKKLDKIMEVLNTKPKVTNDEVEKLLHVSDATATRYLSQLEKEGKITQVGKTGKSVSYSRI